MRREHSDSMTGCNGLRYDFTFINEHSPMEVRVAKVEVLSRIMIKGYD
jgi:hypothetical protein